MSGTPPLTYFSPAPLPPSILLPLLQWLEERPTLLRELTRASIAARRPGDEVARPASAFPRLKVNWESRENHWPTQERRFLGIVRQLLVFSLPLSPSGDETRSLTSAPADSEESGNWIHAVHKRIDTRLFRSFLVFTQQASEQNELWRRVLVYHVPNEVPTISYL